MNAEGRRGAIRSMYAPEPRGGGSASLPPSLYKSQGDMASSDELPAVDAVARSLCNAETRLPRCCKQH
jgi:hypothetical protein